MFVSAKIRLGGLALGLCAALALPAESQMAPAARSSAGQYAIAGRVVNSVTGEPVRRAMVAALSEEDSQTVAAVESDNDGKFSLANLPAAKYQLTASKRGYRTAFYDEHDEFNSAIVTGPEQETGSLVFKLVPGGVIRGVVTADTGDPVENARVFLFTKAHDGKPGTHIVQSDATTTDDTGAYEFDSLAAGDYYLAVTAEPWYALHRSSNHAKRGGPAADSDTPDSAAVLDVAYPVTYFDSTPDEAAATVLTVAGGNRQVADINLHAVPALHLQVDTPRRPDGSLARAELRQTIFGETISAESSGFLDAMQSGSVEFTGVAPGHYELAQGDPARVVEMEATSNQEIDPSVGTSTVSVHGSMRGQGGAPLDEECNLTLDSADPTHHQNSIQSVSMRGGFNFPTVPPGEWELTAECGGSQAAISSITTGTRSQRGNRISVQDRPVTVIVAVSQGTTRLQGFAKRDGKGASGVMVVLVPKDLTAIDGLARRDQSDSDGSFSLRDVVPGQYTLVAIDDGWPLEWMQPAVIARYLPGGVAVTIPDRAGKVTTLTTPVPVAQR
jgi:hypothetical protein